VPGCRPGTAALIYMADLMNGGLPDRESFLAAESVVAAARNRSAFAGRDRRPPALGDLYLLPATAQLPVEWSLIARRPDRPSLVLAVPADTCPLLAGSDVEVPAGSAAGPLSLRCRFGVWLEESLFTPDLYVGALEPELRERASRAVTAAESSTAEESPEYQDWVREVLLPARTAAEALAASAPGRQRRSLEPVFKLAASLLLVTTLGLLAAAIWQQGRIDRLAAREARALAEREAARHSLQQGLAALERERAEAERQRRESSAAPGGPGAHPPEPLLNLPLAFLQPVETRRGEPEAVRLPADTPYLLIVLQVVSLKEHANYRLVLERQGKALWSTDRLANSGLGEIHLALPRQLLAPGSYRLRLQGLRAGRPEPLAEYELRIAE
jgi:hypothetical protein